MWQLPEEPQEGQACFWGQKEAMQESKRYFDEFFIRIILQKSEFFLIISMSM